MSDLIESILENKKKIFAVLFALITVYSAVYVVDPGTRGIVVTAGHVSANASSEGLGLKFPFFSTVYDISVRQHTQVIKAPCYSSDLQTVTGTVKVLYRVPESSVVSIYKDYAGDPFDSLVAPRVQEALKEVTALQSAENIVKQREAIKTDALDRARKKVGSLLVIDDLVIENVDLSDDLERAIEAKMVQQQEKEKAVYVKGKASIDAETALIRAQGEANAIRVRAQAIRDNPGVIQLQIAEKWNGVAPLVVGSGTGANILLPLGK